MSKHSEVEAGYRAAMRGAERSSQRSTDWLRGYDGAMRRERRLALKRRVHAASQTCAPVYLMFPPRRGATIT